MKLICKGCGRERNIMYVGEGEVSLMEDCGKCRHERKSYEEMLKKEKEELLKNNE